MGEVWILDDAQPVAEGIKHRGDADTLADFLQRIQHFGAECNQPGQRVGRIRDAPQRLRT